MGGSLSLTANSDSLSEPGAKSILSDAIEGVSAERLLAGIEQYVREGKTAQGSEAQFDIADRDGGILVSQRFEIPSALGGGSASVFTWYKVDAERSQAEIRLYLTEVSLERGEPISTAWIKVHCSPVKVESWVDAHEYRGSGPIMQGRMDGILAAMGVGAKTSINEPSVGDPSQLSVMSEPIEGTAVTPESFTEFMRSFLVDTRGATELPDGSIMEELVGSLNLGISCYVRSVLRADEARMITYEFGDDESLQELRSTTYLQAHRDPFRLEMWNMQKPRRLAGESELKIIEPLLQGVLKDLQAQG